MRLRARRNGRHQVNVGTETVPDPYRLDRGSGHLIERGVIGKECKGWRDRAGQLWLTNGTAGVHMRFGKRVFPLPPDAERSSLPGFHPKRDHGPARAAYWRARAAIAAAWRIACRLLRDQSEPALFSAPRYDRVDHRDRGVRRRRCYIVAALRFSRANQAPILWGDRQSANQRQDRVGESGREGGAGCVSLFLGFFEPGRLAGKGGVGVFFFPFFFFFFRVWPNMENHARVAPLFRRGSSP